MRTRARSGTQPHEARHVARRNRTLIDRIVLGRAWIPVFGVFLVAIVGMRVEVLKLSSRVGAQIQQASALQSSDAVLRSKVSQLSGNQRIEQLAQKLGMVMPGPMDIHFVPVTAGEHVQAAIRAIHAPEADSFLTGLAGERQADLTSMANAADTSAVGVLANNVTGYYQTATTGASSVAGNSADSTASTGSGGGAGAVAVSNTTTQPGGSTSYSTGSQGSSASTGAATTQTGDTQPQSGSVTTASSADPSSGSVTAPASGQVSTVTSVASGTGTQSTTGGTSLSG